jgi:hypothetical protein
MQPIRVIRIVIGATLIAGSLATLLIIQQQSLASARAEQMDLQAQLHKIPTAPGPPRGRLDLAAWDRADLERLRREALELRSRIAELLAQARRLVTASPWHQPGGVYLDEVLRLADAGDAGQATPTAAMQTFLWALTHGDTNRFAQLMIIEAGADVQRLQAGMLKEVEKASDLFSYNTNVQKSELLLLEEQPAENNDLWIVTEKNGPNDLAVAVMDLEGLETVLVPQPGETGRILLRPTGEGWKFVVSTNGFLVQETIPPP